MGITIHYKGKAKSLEAVDGLIKELQETAEKLGWEYGLVEKDVKGELSPSWGCGYGYVPSKEQTETEGIEFFPAMVSNGCNGYFRFWESKYAEEVRKAFRSGDQPHFFIDTKVKGIWLNVHPQSETLEFVFDLATLELADYQKYDHTPNLIYGYEGFFCKTQYAGVKIHILVCKIIELTEKYIEYSKVYDEAGFYGTGDMQKAAESFWENTAQIRALGEKLKEMAKGTSVEVISGYEL
ncbi:MAG: hypothetical protein A4E62_00575 [Syntrophorhabdus sp. PtaU1.Bin002]|nr:MAG: hypothetical protein A4E62_00575 [Syntrophorhabdus sp. PtaU1.Bin002]